eukprot:scaffold118789_cov36-Phaeocystis_antarctica.AAC.1
MQENLRQLDYSIAKDHELAYHFTSHETAALILSGSHGLRASIVGQLGGGVSVCKKPPHEMGWEQWGGGEWRETLGKKLWGEKWREVLPGGPHADKLEMVIVVKVMSMVFNDDTREDILIIPESVLESRDGFHYYGLVRT